MKRYIDAEKLISEIERFSATEYGGNTLGDDVAKGALDYVLEEIIPSLQQEQPEVDLEKYVFEYMKIHRLHIKDGGRVVFENGDAPNFKSDILNVAQYFYELGKVLNARKKE